MEDVFQLRGLEVTDRFLSFGLMFDYFANIILEPEDYIRCSLPKPFPCISEMFPREGTVFSPLNIISITVLNVTRN